MTKNELLNDKNFQEASDDSIIVYEDTSRKSYILGEPTMCFRRKVMFSCGYGMTKGELLKSKAFCYASGDTELMMSSNGERLFLLTSISVEPEEKYIIIKEEI